MPIESIGSLQSQSRAESQPIRRRFHRRKWCDRVVRLTVLFLILTPALSAQVSATLSGTVTDQSGATAPGAAVTVKNLETGAIRTATTEQAGRYQVFSLSIG